ncbi:hypothetical protein ACI65C_008412 [Semiaphis heraclei]
MEANIKIDESDYAYPYDASNAEPTHLMLRKYSYDVGNGNRNKNGRSHNHIGKDSSKINNTNVVDTLDLAVPQSKVRPIDRLLERYDWSSKSMTPLLKDSDRPLQQTQEDRPQSLPVRSAPPPVPRRPLQAPSRLPPPRPPRSYPSELVDHIQPVRKSLWKRTRESVSSFFERTVAAVPNVDCLRSHL